MQHFKRSSILLAALILVTMAGTAAAIGQTATNQGNIWDNNSHTLSTNATTSTSTSLNLNNVLGTSTQDNLSAEQALNSTSSTSTATSTAPSGNTSTTAPESGSNIVGWVILSPEFLRTLGTSTLNHLKTISWGNPGSSTSTATTTAYTYINGYPTIEGNYFDCYGNIDNDRTHHTTNPRDTDPVHRVGQNCPGGAPLPPNSNPNPFWMMNNTPEMWALGGWWSSFQNQFHWTIIPIRQNDFLGILGNLSD